MGWISHGTTLATSWVLGGDFGPYLMVAPKLSLENTWAKGAALPTLHQLQCLIHANTSMRGASTSSLVTTMTKLWRQQVDELLQHLWCQHEYPHQYFRRLQQLALAKTLAQGDLQHLHQHRLCQHLRHEGLHQHLQVSKTTRLHQHFGMRGFTNIFDDYDDLSPSTLWQDGVHYHLWPLQSLQQSIAVPTT